jgi:hypothetical protein
LPSRTSATFAKRQKEQARREKQQAKFQRKQQRKLEKRDPLPDSESGSPGSTTDTDSSFEPLSATNLAAAGTATTEKEIQ